MFSRIKQSCKDKYPNRQFGLYCLIKFYIYKPIRNWLCHYGYREWEDEYCIMKRREFIERCKNV